MKSQKFLLFVNVYLNAVKYHSALGNLVSFATLLVSREERCVTTQITAAKDTIGNCVSLQIGHKDN